MITRGHTNTRIKRYGDILNRLENDEEVLLSKEEKKLFKERLSDKYFFVSFPKPVIVYLFRRLDMLLTNSNSGIWGHPTIEHVLPQSIHAGWGVDWPDKKAVEEWTHSMGNLLLLPKGINSAAGDKPFIDKKAVYKKWIINNKNLGAKLVEEVVVEGGWTLKEVKYHHERRTFALSKIWDLDSISSSK